MGDFTSTLRVTEGDDSPTEDDDVTIIGDPPIDGEDSTSEAWEGEGDVAVTEEIGDATTGAGANLLNNLRG